MFSEEPFEEETPEDLIERDNLRTAKMLFIRKLLQISPPALREEIGKIDSSVDVAFTWEARDRANEKVFRHEDSDISSFHRFDLSVSLFKVKYVNTDEIYGKRLETVRCTFNFNPSFMNQTLKLIDDDWLEERAELELMDEERSPREILLLDAEKRAARICTEQLEMMGHYDAINSLIGELRKQCHEAMGIKRDE